MESETLVNVRCGSYDGEFRENEHREQAPFIPITQWMSIDSHPQRSHGVV